MNIREKEKKLDLIKHKKKGAQFLNVTEKDIEDLKN